MLLIESHDERQNEQLEHLKMNPGEYTVNRWRPLAKTAQENFINVSPQ